MIISIFEKFPWYIKYPSLALVLLIMIPLRIREEMINMIHSEVYAIVIPLKEKRDMELLRMREDIHEIKQDTRDIRNHLLGK